MEAAGSEKACKFSRVRLAHYLDEGGGAGQINRQAETELLTGERPAKAEFSLLARLLNFQES